MSGQLNQPPVKCVWWHVWPHVHDIICMGVGQQKKQDYTGLLFIPPIQLGYVFHHHKKLDMSSTSAGDYWARVVLLCCIKCTCLSKASSRLLQWNSRNIILCVEHVIDLRWKRQKRHSQAAKMQTDLFFSLQNSWLRAWKYHGLYDENTMESMHLSNKSPSWFFLISSFCSSSRSSRCRRGSLTLAVWPFGHLTLLGIFQ